MISFILAVLLALSEGLAQVPPEKIKSNSAFELVKFTVAYAISLYTGNQPPSANTYSTV